ncbi:hypothetical protein ARMSODRAFT_1068645 [Armillaria solidipes]|uniref:Uncharacterized protein n=1 Tax=Armillaria solidipes TaxID=1076256 RepID=A0A2H3B711_9AGAR|nr:hypothetical protein ARMSODRAFT_1068645 [Armillaria solidipes]
MGSLLIFPPPPFYSSSCSISSPAFLLVMTFNLSDASAVLNPHPIKEYLHEQERWREMSGTFLGYYGHTQLESIERDSVSTEGKYDLMITLPSYKRVLKTDPNLMFEWYWVHQATNTAIAMLMRNSPTTPVDRLTRWQSKMTVIVFDPLQAQDVWQSLVNGRTARHGYGVQSSELTSASSSQLGRVISELGLYRILDVLERENLIGGQDRTNVGYSEMISIHSFSGSAVFPKNGLTLPHQYQGVHPFGTVQREE